MLYNTFLKSTMENYQIIVILLQFFEKPTYSLCFSILLAGKLENDKKNNTLGALEPETMKNVRFGTSEASRCSGDIVFIKFGSLEAPVP